MSTAILQKTPVKAEWKIDKLHEETANAIARHFLATMATLGQYGPEAHQEFVKHMITSKVEHFKSLGVNTPIDLVKVMGEFESNIFGSKIEIVGDEKKAELTYNECACWAAMQRVGKMTPEQEEKMGQHFELQVKNLGEAFGFKGEVRFEEPKAIVTFSK